MINNAESKLTKSKEEQSALTKNVLFHVYQKQKQFELRAKCFYMMKKTLLLKNDKSKILSLLNKIKVINEEIEGYKSSLAEKNQRLDGNYDKNSPSIDTLTISYMKYLENYNKELIGSSGDKTRPKQPSFLH